MSDARVVRCPSCGSGFPLGTLVPRVECPFCHAAVQVDPATWESLHRYSDRVDGEIQKAEEHLAHVAAWSQTTESLKPGAYLMPVAIILGLSLLGGLGAYLAQSSPDFDPAATSITFTIAANVVAVSWVAWSFIKRARVKGEKVRSSEHRVACPGCGAPNPIAAGARHVDCRYCGAALMASGTVMAEAMDAARQAARVAAMARYRAEREGMVRLMRYSKPNLVFWIVGGQMGLGVAIALVAGTYSALQGETPWMPVLMGWVGSIAVGGLVAIIAAFLRGRRERWYAAADELAAQFNGTVARDVGGLVAWLNRYWAGPFKQAHIAASTGYVALSTEALGYPVLVDLSPRQQDQYRPPRLQVLVAADIPDAALESRAAWTDRTRAIRADLLAQGFESHLGEGGVLLVAKREVIRGLRNHPDAIHALAPILRAAVGVARSVGAVPVGPIP